MVRPSVLVLGGYGLNCEEETAFAFLWAGAKRADIVHINDLAGKPKKLATYQILAIGGGFAYGDDTGSGKAYANKLKNHLKEELELFQRSDKLIVGICNGFQILVNAGLLPGALVHNEQPRYIDRWVDLKIENESPWLVGIKTLTLPVAHGEGKFFAEPELLSKISKNGQIAARYTKGEISKMTGLPANPNGSQEDIAAVTDETGRILGVMPHPERAMFFHQLPHWTLLKEEYLRGGMELPDEGPGLQIFKNAVHYFN